MTSKRHLRHILNNYVSGVSDTLGCVSHHPVFLMAAGDGEDANTFLVHAVKARPFPLGGGGQIWLTFAQTIRLVPDVESGSSQVRIVGYHYRIGHGEAGSEELIAYHFDPYNEESSSQEPHLHVGRSAYRSLRKGPCQNFHKRHIPTGHVTFPMVIRFLIDELGVEPINPGWDMILTETGPA